MMEIFFIIFSNLRIWVGEECTEVDNYGQELAGEGFEFH